MEATTEHTLAWNYLLPSVLYYTFTCFFSNILFQISYLRKKNSNLKLLIYELISSFTIVACSMENGFIRKNFGDFSFLFVIFILSQVFSYIFTLPIAGTPCNSVIKYYNGESSKLHCLLSVLFQIIGGCLAHLYARSWCGLGWTYFHKVKFANTQCTSLVIPVGLGCLVEFGAVFSDNLIDSYYSYKNNVSSLSSKLKFTLKCIVTLTWINYGVNWSGMYMNPVNASAQTILCDNSYILSHLLVYWISPLLAVTVAQGFKNPKTKSD